MTYNVFGGTLNLTQRTNWPAFLLLACYMNSRFPSHNSSTGRGYLADRWLTAVRHTQPPCLRHPWLAHTWCLTGTCSCRMHWQYPCDACLLDWQTRVAPTFLYSICLIVHCAMFLLSHFLAGFSKVMLDSAVAANFVGDIEMPAAF